MSVLETVKVVNSIPRIGEQAPDFEAVSTWGNFKFSEYNKDSWLVFFAHPADFTPVCTTELIAFAKEKEFFQERNTKLLGVSVDSIHSHLAWVQNIDQNTSVKLDYPLIADINKNVSQTYGLLHPEESSTAAVRAVFIIDPKSIIRAIIYYPLNVGRNVEEVKRVLTALQFADQNKVALPANWKPGEKVVVPPPKTLEDLKKRNNGEYVNDEKVDFYLIKKELV